MFNTAIELPVIYSMIGEEDDYEFGTLSDHFFLWSFISISSYGRAEYLECTKGTMLISDGVEYFTYLPIETVESLIAQAKFNDLMSNTINFNQN